MDIIVENGVMNKSFKNICGIYMWINHINNKKYIGRSVDVKYRVNREIKDFNNNKNGNLIKLYNAVKKYGVKNFSVFLVERVNKECLLNKEKYYVKYFDSKNKGYNCNYGGEGNIGHNVTQEQIKKQIKSLNNYWTEKRRKYHSDKMKDFYKQNPDNIERMKLTQKEKHKTDKVFRKKFMKAMEKYNNSEEGKLKAKKQSNSLKNTYKNNPYLSKNLSIKNSKTYKLLKNGNVISITNLTKYCSDKQLSFPSMYRVATGKKDFYKEYKKLGEKIWPNK